MVSRSSLTFGSSTSAGTESKVLDVRASPLFVRQVNLTTAQRALATRRRIRLAAERLFLRDGYLPTTMTTIAAEAGVAEKTVYLAFPTKADLLNEIIRIGVRGDEGSTPVSQREEWREMRASRSVDLLLHHAASRNAALMHGPHASLPSARRAPRSIHSWRNCATAGIKTSGRTCTTSRPRSRRSIRASTRTASRKRCSLSPQTSLRTCGSPKNATGQNSNTQARSAPSSPRSSTTRRADHSPARRAGRESLRAGGD